MGSLCNCYKNQEEDVQAPVVSSSNGDITKNSFKVIKLLGKGNFGKVCLVEKNDTKELFAMKILKKELIDEKKQKIHTQTERKILEEASNPFITKLFYAFQTPAKLYMVMEYLNGGDMFFHLTQQRVFSEIRAKFYVCEIFLGLEYLHAKGVIYRDLKPENILLDKEGHIRLTDFGLSKKGIDEENPKAYTFCGTAEYLAPEIIRGLGYDKSVDYWSLGAVLYYMLSGAPPYYSSDKNETFKNPNERLSDTQRFKSHPWFNDMNWDDVYQKKIKPPYQPKTKNPKDVSNFDKAFTHEKIEESFDFHDLSPSPNQYSGFTYKDRSLVTSLDDPLLNH